MDITNTIDMIVICCYLLTINIMSLKIYEKIFNKKFFSKKEKNKGNKKIYNKEKIIKFFIRIILITCNTILYCVLYNQKDRFFIILDSIYILILMYIGMYDIKNKIITNKSNAILSLVSLIAYFLEKISVLNIYELQNFQGYIFEMIILKILTILIVSSFMILLRKILKNQIGGGDIKMLIALLIRFEFSKFLVIIFISLISASIYSLYLLLIKKKEKDYKFAFGQFISTGAIIALFIN